MKIVFSFPQKILQKNNRDVMQEILNAGSIMGSSLTTLTRRGRYLGGTGNVNGMQFFTNSKGISSNRGRPESCQCS